MHQGSLMHRSGHIGYIRHRLHRIVHWIGSDRHSGEALCTGSVLEHASGGLQADFDSGHRTSARLCGVLDSVVVMIGSMPSELHMAIISKGPQPPMRLAFHCAPRDGRAQGGPVHSCHKA